MERVSGYGNFYKDQPYARDQITINDEAADGNPVHGTVQFSYYGNMSICYDTAGAPCWWVKSTQSTDDYGTAQTPVTVTKSSTLETAGWKVRGKSMVCAQMGFPVPDSCSDYADATVTLSY